VRRKESVGLFFFFEYPISFLWRAALQERCLQGRNCWSSDTENGQVQGEQVKSLLRGKSSSSTNIIRKKRFFNACFIGAVPGGHSELASEGRRGPGWSSAGPNHAPC
jgi:hypothetical protein